MKDNHNILRLIKNPVFYLFLLTAFFANSVFAAAQTVNYPVPSSANIQAANTFSGQYCTIPNTYAIVGYSGGWVSSGALYASSLSGSPDLCNASLTWNIVPYKSTCLAASPTQLTKANVAGNTGNPSGTTTVTYTAGSANFYANASNIKGQVCQQVKDGPDTFLLYTCGALQSNPNFISCCYTTTGGADNDCTIQAQ